MADDVLVGRISTVFRTAGYDGASLSMLAGAARLHTASLYHRFPGGKAQMAAAVLEDVGRQFGNVLAPLSESEDVADGVREMSRRVAAFYADGRLACVLDTMTLDGAPVDVKQHAGSLARGWIEAMSGAAARAGAGEAEAVRRGRDAFVRIEGSLVLARVLDDPSAFLQTLEILPQLLTDQVVERAGREGARS